jgi:CDP-2,3-bis-(O-geranylgeranyl)-sn-glycerol synthase
MTPDPLVCAIFLIVAFVLAGLLHSAWLRSSVSRRLMIPLDAGATVRGRRVFGDNKTVRGFVVMVPAAAISFAALAGAMARLSPALAAAVWPLSASGFAALGAWAGLGFMLGELPNSFVKRQLDIAPGDTPRGRGATVAGFVVDRLDSIVGMLAAVSLAAPTPWMTWLYVLLLGPAIHWSFSVLLYRIGVKARPA